MSSGRIEKEREASIPLDDSKIWFIGVLYDGYEMQDFEFRNTYDGRMRLLSFLRNMKEEYFIARCYCVWNGQYQTNLFEVTPERFISKLTNFIVNKGKEPAVLKMILDKEVTKE